MTHEELCSTDLNVKIFGINQKIKNHMCKQLSNVH